MSSQKRGTTKRTTTIATAKQLLGMYRRLSDPTRNGFPDIPALEAGAPEKSFKESIEKNKKILINLELLIFLEQIHLLAEEVKLQQAIELIKSVAFDIWFKERPRTSNNAINEKARENAISINREAAVAKNKQPIERKIAKNFLDPSKNAFIKAPKYTVPTYKFTNIFAKFTEDLPIQKNLPLQLSTLFFVSPAIIILLLINVFSKIKSTLTSTQKSKILQNQAKQDAPFVHPDKPQLR